MNMEIIKKNSETLVEATKRYLELLEEGKSTSQKKKIESYLRSLLSNIEKNINENVKEPIKNISEHT